MDKLETEEKKPMQILLISKCNTEPQHESLQPYHTRRCAHGRPSRLPNLGQNRSQEPLPSDGKGPKLRRYLSFRPNCLYDLVLTFSSEQFF